MKKILFVAALLMLAMNCINAQSENDDHMLNRYSKYNHWANQAMTAWIAAASDAQMLMEIESSFNTLRQTALHIWSAEYLWLKVLKDETYEDNPARNFEGSTEALIAGWLATSAEFHDWVSKLDPAEYTSVRGSESRSMLRVDEIIQHCMNHSTYHRGQLITMGRQAGLKEPPRTDFIYFVWQ